MKAYEHRETLEAIQAVAEAIAHWAQGKGFWPDLPPARTTAEEQMLIRLMKSQKLALVMTELGEAVESLRGKIESSIPGFTNEEEEIADSVIRLFDYAGHYGLRLGEAIGAKMAKNEGRPYMHGKSF